MKKAPLPGLHPGPSARLRPYPTFVLSRSRAKPKTLSRSARGRAPPRPALFLPRPPPSPRHPRSPFLPDSPHICQVSNSRFPVPSPQAAMPTLRSATAGASPAAASTPRSVKRRLTSPDAPRHTSPHRSPHAGAGTVRSTALLGLLDAGCSAVAPFHHPSVPPVAMRANCSISQVCTPKLLSASPKSSRKRLYGDLVAAEKPKWNPRGKPRNFHFSQHMRSLSSFFLGA